MRSTLNRYRLAVAFQLRNWLLRHGYHSTPSFLIIGAQKAGTTALYYYLAGHPSIAPSAEKELTFFAPEIFANWPQHPRHPILWSGDRAALDDPEMYRRALAWYHGNFPLPHSLRGRLTFEATPEYLYYPRAAQRIFAYNPQMQLIVLLREPVQRAFSAWNMYQRFGEYRPLIYAPRRETRAFEDAIHEEIAQIRAGSAPLEPGYVQRGMYFDQLRRYLGLFPARQLLILDSRELYSRPREVIHHASRFLGLPIFEPEGLEPMHLGDYIGAIPPGARDELRAFYAPYNHALYEFLDRDFGW